jgi:hypothetical protein
VRVGQEITRCCSVHRLDERQTGTTTPPRLRRYPSTLPLLEQLLNRPFGLPSIVDKLANEFTRDAPPACYSWEGFAAGVLASGVYGTGQTASCDGGGVMGGARRGRWVLAVAVALAAALAGAGAAGAASGTDASMSAPAGARIDRTPAAQASTPIAATFVVDHLPPGISGVGETACPSSLDCWALGSGASGVDGIVATTDGGISWSLQTAPDASRLDALACAPGTEDCWAVGTIGSWGGAVIVATSPSSPGWSVQPLPAGVGALESISCPTPMDCVAVGAIFTGEGSDDGADVVVTTDGGLSWTAYPAQPGVDSDFTGVSCPTTSDCTALGTDQGLAGLIYGSTDGGETWTDEYEAKNLSGRRFTGVSCPATSTCYVVGQSQSNTGFGSVIEVTSDGGATWSAETPPAGASKIGLDGVSCPTVSNCWTSDGSFFETTVSSFFETTDGGSTWTAAGPSVPQANLSGPTCPDASTCIAGGTTVGDTPAGLVVSTRNAQGLGCDGTLPAGAAAGLAPDPDGGGYWLASTGGGVVACGTSAFYGSLPVELETPSAPIVAIAAATDGDGYYLLAQDGTVYGFGPGAFVSGSGPAAGAPYVGMAVDGGYWLVSADGGVFSFGAPYLGSLPGLGIRVHDIVGIAADDATGGYRLLGADGGVFSFDAAYRGSLPGLGIQVSDIVAVTSAPDSGGYYLVGSDGGVFTFGPGLPFCGSASGRTSGPVVAAALYPFTDGYWLTGLNGALYGFNAPDDGTAWSPAGLHMVC